MLVSIVVPVYKKEKIIKDALCALVNVLETVATNYNFDYEILAVEDGKLDLSGEIISKLNHPKVKLISYAQNKGKGFAVKYGMLQAEGDYIGYIDAGLDISPNVITHLIESLISNPDCHIALGSKFHAKSELVYPIKRKILTWGNAVVTRIFTGVKVVDTQVGAKLYTRQLVLDVVPRLMVKRFAFEVEFLAVANHLGYKKYLEVPVQIDFTIDPSSAARMVEVVKIIRDTMAVGYRLYILKFYTKNDFSNYKESISDLLITKV